MTETTFIDLYEAKQLAEVQASHSNLARSYLASLAEINRLLTVLHNIAHDCAAVAENSNRTEAMAWRSVGRTAAAAVSATQFTAACGIRESFK